MYTVNLIMFPFLTFVVFSLIVADHAKNFRGASNTFRLILHIISFLGGIGLFAVLISVGINEIWYVAVLLGLIGYIVAGILKVIIVRIIGHSNIFILSIVGIVVIPITLFYMLKLLIA